MKKILQTGLVICMTFLSAAVIGQTQIPVAIKAEESVKTAKSYLDLMVNVVSTNLNYGNANSSLEDYKKSNHGIQFGAAFQAGITPWFSVVPELYFLRKGGTLKVNNPLTNGELVLHINTIELPVLARFHFGQFYINAGPSIAYSLSGSSKFEGVSTKFSFDNALEGFKRFDAGVQVGGGVELPCKQRRIALDIRYNYGLTNISYDKEIYNRAVMVSIHISKAWKTNPFGRK